MTTLLLVDDEDVVRSGLRLLLTQDETLTVVAEARDGAEAIVLTRELSPEVVLLDLHMPNVDGLSALLQLRLRQAVPEAKVERPDGGSILWVELPRSLSTEQFEYALNRPVA